jgi:pyruvate kinase
MSFILKLCNAAHVERILLTNRYFYDALRRLIDSGRLTPHDKVAHLSGSLGAGGGTSFLEINEVGKVFDAGKEYRLPTFNH